MKITTGLTASRIMSIMGVDYRWAAKQAPRGWVTLGEVGRFLDLSRHAARRRLLASGLPAVLLVKHWRDPRTGQWYSRRCWILPEETLEALMLAAHERLFRTLGRHARPALRRWGQQRRCLHQRLRDRPTRRWTPRARASGGSAPV